MPGSIECRLAALSALIATSLIVLTNPAAAQQQPSTAQRDAIRSACRPDYESYCASVPPGGKPSLMCLQKNMTSLSADCQKAVNAVGKSSAAPAATPKSSATAPSSAPPAQAATGASPPPASPAPAGTPPATAPPQATVGAATVAPPPRALTPRREFMLVRSSCSADYRTYCGNVAFGGGRVAQCLRTNQASLSPTCQSALMGLRSR